MNIIQSKKIRQNFQDIKLPKTSTLFKNTLKISIPAALETFLVGMMGMFDTMMVGTYAKEALAAVSIAQQPVFITLAACIGLNAGIIAIISRRKGENKKEDANKVLKQVLVVGTILSLVIAIFSILLARPFMSLAGAKSDTIEYAVSYFRIVTSGLVFNYIRLMICSAQRATGKTKITLATNVISNVINVFLNYCLINGNLGFPELGVQGAAIATVIGNTVALIIAFISIYKRKGFLSIRIKENWRLDKDTLSLVFRISLPAFVEQLFMRVGFFIIAIIVNNLGTHVTAVNAIISNIMSISFNITDGFAIGASALVGKSLGEKDTPKAFAYGRISQLLSFGIAFISMAAAIILRKELASCFSTEADVINEASDYIVYTCVIMIPQSVQWVTTGILRGAGDTKYTARNSMISVTVIRPLASFLLCYPIGLGLIGSWIGMFIDQMIRCVFNSLRFSSLKWAKIKV